MAIIRKGTPFNIAVHHTVPGSTGARNIEELKSRARSYDNYHRTKSIGWGIDTPGENGYKYIRYHYLIAKDGSYIGTQKEKYVLYHASDGAKGQFNYYGIGIALDGNYETESPTDAQKETLAKLIAEFEKRYDVNVNVRGHKEVSQTATACPGKNVGTSKSGWLRSVIVRANEILANPEQSETDKLKAELDKCKKELESINSQYKTLANEYSNLEDVCERLEDELKAVKTAEEESTDRLLAIVYRRVKEEEKIIQ